MKSVGGEIPKLVKKAFAKRGMFNFSLIKHWQSIVPGYAPYCYPLSLRGDVLTLAVNSDSAAMGIKMQEVAIISRVNTYLGGSVATRLRTVRKDFETREVHEKKEIIPDEEARAKAKEMVKGVQDEKMREKLESLSAVFIMSNRSKK
ncbi:MAG: DUF721 domain-containing protein [Alphaproteobacteria bacterium]|jgi:hypothetical protein|nr:DUF721 domain-containing protein [Alphaproteobacteria bacterium]